MAQLNYRELLAAVRQHPEYYGGWEGGVPAAESLYIVLAQAAGT